MPQVIESDPIKSYGNEPAPAVGPNLINGYGNDPRIIEALKRATGLDEIVTRIGFKADAMDNAIGERIGPGYGLCGEGENGHYSIRRKNRIGMYQELHVPAAPVDRALKEIDEEQAAARKKS